MENINESTVALSEKALLNAEEQNKQIITVITLPEIKTTISELLPRIKAVCAEACKLKCSEESRKEIKEARARLNKANKELTEQFKQAIGVVKAPITAVENSYKECTDEFKKADSELGAKIATVEDSIKAQKKAKLNKYFGECVQSAGIDFLTIEMVQLNITLSASEKSLKDKIKSFVDGVSNDLKMIDTLDHKEEILVEYKSCCNISQAVTIVNERHKRIEAEKQCRKAVADEAQRRYEAEQKAIKTAAEGKASATAVSRDDKIPENNVNIHNHGVSETAIPDYVIPPTVTSSKATLPSKIYMLKFSVSGTMEQLREFKPKLIELIERSGLDYE